MVERWNGRAKRSRQTRSACFVFCCRVMLRPRCCFVFLRMFELNSATGSKQRTHAATTPRKITKTFRGCGVVAVGCHCRTTALPGKFFAHPQQDHFVVKPRRRRRSQVADRAVLVPLLNDPSDSKELLLDLLYWRTCTHPLEMERNKIREKKSIARSMGGQDQKFAKKITGLDVGNASAAPLGIALRPYKISQQSCHA